MQYSWILTQYVLRMPIFKLKGDACCMQEHFTWIFVVSDISSFEIIVKGYSGILQNCLHTFGFYLQIINWILVSLETKLL